MTTAELVSPSYLFRTREQHVFTQSSRVKWDPTPSRPAFLAHLMSVLNAIILNSVGGENNWFATGAVGVAALLITTVAYYALNPKDEEHDFPRLRGIQLYHAWNFFRRRHDFLQSNFKKNLGKSFSFNVLHHNIVVLAGEDARRVFFSNPDLDLDEGYKILGGAVHVSLSQSPGILLISILGATGQGCGNGEREGRGKERRYLQQEVESALEQDPYSR